MPGAGLLPLRYLRCFVGAKSLTPIRRRTFLGAAGVLLAGMLSGCGLRRGGGGTATAMAPYAPATAGPAQTPRPNLRDVFATPREVQASRAVEVIAREGWGAKKPKVDRLRPHAIERLTVHHSATPLKKNRDAPSHWRLFQKIHRRKRPDIAYHLLIDRKGNVYEGRPVLASGESTSRKHGYDATGHLLVLCDGNFEVQRPTRKQLIALVDVLAWASVRFGVDPSTISGHRDHAPTACPGRRLYSVVRDGSLERAVRQRIAAGGVDLVLVEGRRAKMRVAAIEGR